jgi:two-component system, sensor histidine kinase and response regulator
MKGDEEKCLRAGMNGYISKPINQDMMFHTLWKSIGPFRKSFLTEKIETRNAPEPEVDKTDISRLPDSLPAINIRDTLENLQIDQPTLRRILLGFYRNNLQTISKMKIAFEHEDWDDLRLMAHSLKGSAANIGADPLHIAARALEEVCADKALCPLAAKVIDNLETALNKVLNSIGSLLTPTEDKAVDEKMPDMDPTQGLSTILALAEALELADPESIRQSLQLVRQYLSKAVMQQLEIPINDYKYDEALELLKEIKVQLRIL